MTLFVAIRVPSKEMLAEDRALSWEPGLIFAADTRYSFERGARLPQDDGKKVGKINSRAIVGFAGDGPLCVGAFARIQSRLQQAKIRKPRRVARALAQCLHEQRSEIEAVRGRNARKTLPSIVMLGTYNRTNDRYQIHSLDSADNFAPRPESAGVLVRGTGAVEFANSFAAAQAHYVHGWKNRRLSSLGHPPTKVFPHPDPDIQDLLIHHPPQSGERKQFDVPLNDTEGAMVGEMDDAIQRSTVDSVGGKVQIVALSNKVLPPIVGMKSSDGGKTWSQTTPSKPLRTPREMA